MRGTHFRRRGISLVWTAVALPMWIAMLGLALDTGWALLATHHLQDAADATALAAAQPMKGSAGLDQIRLTAVAVAEKNLVTGDPVVVLPNYENLTDGDVVAGRYNHARKRFTPRSDAINAVKIVARRKNTSPYDPVELFFGPMFGVNSVDVERTAIACNLGGTGAALVALCPDCECAFRIEGGAILDVQGGVIQVESTANCAACGTAGTINAPGMDIAGRDSFGFAVSSSGSCMCSGVMNPRDIDTAASPLGDPLEWLAEPPWQSMADALDRGTIETSGTYLPGYYSGGVDLADADGPHTVTLLPGVYVFDGAGLKIRGSSVLIAEECVCFIPPGFGTVDIAGTNVIRMSPPVSGDYQGVTLFQSRSNANEARIVGADQLQLTGTNYFPAAPLTIAGTGSGFGNQLIAWTIRVRVPAFSSFLNPEITIEYDGRFPPIQNTVYLVK